MARDACPSARCTSGGEGTAESVRWTPTVVTPFERRDFEPPEGYQPGDKFAAAFPEVVLRGTMRDALGDEHRIEDRVDVATFWQHLVRARSFGGYEPTDRALSLLTKHLERTNRSLNDLVRVARGTDTLTRLRRGFEHGAASSARTAVEGKREEPGSDGRDEATED